MTAFPGPSLPLPRPVPLPDSVPPPKSDNRLAILISWLIILSVVAYVGVDNYRSSHDKRMERAASAIEMEIASRSVVGYATFIRRFGMSAQLQQKLPDLTSSVTSSAAGDRQSLMAVAVVGELQGNAAALAKLDSINARLKDLSDDDDGVELRKDAASLRKIYTTPPADLSDQDRTRLVSRLGWFGKLALVAGLSDSAPSRRLILDACMRAMAATLSVELLLGGLLIAGLVLMIIAIVKLSKGNLRLNYVPAPYAGSAFIEVFALYILGFVAIGRIAHALHASSPMPVYGIALIWIAGCCLWPRVRGLRFAEIRAGLGWTSGRGALVEAAMGLIGYLAFMPILAIAIVTSAFLAHLTHEHAIHPIVFDAGANSKSAIIGLFLLASGFAPVVEETMFRGALFHHLRRSHRWLLSAALTALIFAAVHPQGWTAIPVLGGIGFAFAGIREWRGNIIASGTAHAINNAVAMTMMLLILG